LEGSNASAEEADEGTDEASESGIDIVLNHRLVETGFPDKKAFTDYLKGYMKKVVKFLEENNKAAEVDSFKTNIQKVKRGCRSFF
jgi:Translationally controlled tumour protein